MTFVVPPPHGPELDDRVARIDPDVVYSIPHEVGQPCAVIVLLHESFGAEVGEALLWERTCFPFSDVVAWEQAKELVKADCRPMDISSGGV